MIDQEAPFRANGDAPIVWYRRRLRNSNHYCLYCGRFVGPGSEVASDREHLIGRKFVPSGTLADGAFNFIFRACRECNADKSDAERHVSTVTLINSPERTTDPYVAEIAEHKAKRDYHPIERGKLVADASVSQEVFIPATFGSMTFNLVGPPQLDPRMVCLLSVRHVQALFALVTTTDPRDSEESRILPPHNALVFGYYSSRDWGNPQILELVRRTDEWDCRLRLTTASGYFRAVLKRSAVDSDGWFWGLEWNRSLRVFGAIADPDDMPEWLVKDLPDLKWRGSGTFRLRGEVPIDDEKDTFFEFPD